MAYRRAPLHDTSVRLRFAPRPWVLRALVLTAVYGVAQALFVALRSWSPDLMGLWSIVLLLVVVAVVIGWVGAEIVLDRRPPEWTWFLAALVTAPAAGLLSWILLALLVDGTGVADLQAALFGRASFTALLVLASVFVGNRLGWLSMRRHGEGAGDPMLDADDDEVAREVAEERAPSAARAAARVGVVVPARVVPAAEPAVAGVRTPRRRSPERVPETVPGGGPEVAERERMPEASRLAGHRRASTVRPAAPPPEPVSSPFGTDTSPEPAGDVPESLEPPVVAVLPAFPRPGGPLDPTGSQPAVDPDALGEPDVAAPGDQEPERGPRRKFGLRRPKG
ncbi:hypothetical protein PHK61_04050 [Actinomycetospora lutea]|uniref:hypothetical protein n=1 Tax=Actinomycetospora lutea TaxID=663604 RepID=UPI0023655657|nr:hypothetical protein [Actinomycetospora lutea]MDD7937591.1 hypothetical protein [Actinomycetospora lutea]